MPNGQAVGRTAEMADGAERVREPKFTVQQESKYTRSSVLDNLMPSGLGMSAADRQRRLMGAVGSPSGVAEGTFEKRLWLDQKQASPARYKSEER